MISEVVEDVKNYIQFLSSIGCRGFECSDKTLKTMRLWANNNTSGKNRLQSSRMAILDNQWKKCVKCKFSRGRKNLIPGRGNCSSKIMFVADMPSYADDYDGVLFSGETGSLFSKMIGAIGLSIEEVFITTAIKCRPEVQIKFNKEDYKTCMDYLTKQIDFIKPEIICTLGGASTSVLLGDNINLVESRGKFHQYKGIKVFPTFHPDFLSRYPSKKRDAWEDLKKLKKAIYF